jgi:hypothetical protein
MRDTAKGTIEIDRTRAGNAHTKRGAPFTSVAPMGVSAVMCAWEIM